MAFIAVLTMMLVVTTDGTAGGSAGGNGGGNGGSSGGGSNGGNCQTGDDNDHGGNGGKSGFLAGDLFVSLASGEVQWRRADGTFVKTLRNAVPGKADGMGFDASLNLYVTHFCADPTCRTGNSVERFSRAGASLGVFGRGYSCNPSSITFDAAGNSYVGQADCTGDVLKFSPSGLLLATYDVAVDNRGSLYVDLAPDGCTLFYTSASYTIKRFNVCAGVQMADCFTLPDVGFGIKVLSDGGVLIADNSAIIRLDAAGQVVQTYDVPGQPDLWLSVDLAQNGSFWAANYGSSDVYRFDLATGAVLDIFNTGTPYFTVKAVAAVRSPTTVTSGGRMTGGGSVFTTANMRVTHGFELHCDASRLPNNLEVNWKGGKFHLDTVTAAGCTDDPTISPKPPAASFDTYHAHGTGRYNGEKGATIVWTFTDAGEPGRKDRATMTITDPGGVVVLEVSNTLTYGNHQAHK